jgi:arylsulfatase A-like enzyme
MEKRRYGPIGSRLALALLLVAFGAHGVAAAPRYNVLLIVLDDLPFAALPFYNPPIDFTAEAPSDPDTRLFRTGTANRLEARMLAAGAGAPNSGALGTFRPSEDFTPSGPGADGLSPWRAYPVCAVDALVGGTCDPTFRYVPIEDCVGPTPPAQCSDPDFDKRVDVLPGHGGLQRLANSGLVFTRFYATSAVCLPTRASMMTGMHGQRTGATANGGEARIAGGRRDPTSVMTLPRLLKERAGYRTALVGKWHVTTRERGIAHATPLDDLFTDAIYDNDCCRGPFKAIPLECIGDGRRNRGLCSARGAWDYYSGPTHIGPEANCNQPNVPVRNTHTVGCNFSVRGYADLAEEYLEKMRQSGESFFLTVGFHATHDPHQAPRRTKRHYEGWPNVERTTAFWGLVEETDAAVGRILDALERTGLDSNTVVIFTNDQGPDGTRPRFGDPRLAEGKASVTDGGIRVTFLAVPPGALRNPASEPTYVDHVSSHVDVYRTIASLAGVSPSDPDIIDRDGVDLSGAILRGETPPREATYTRFGGQVSAITGPGFFQNMASSAASAGRDAQTPLSLTGLCAYAPDPETLNASEIRAKSGGECPGVVLEGSTKKLAICVAAPRGASYRLCSDDPDCGGVSCKIAGRRCVPSGSSEARTPEDLAIRARCTGGTDCRPGEECKDVTVPCNRCIAPKWKIMTDAASSPPMVLDVVSNPEEEHEFDFMRAKAVLGNDPCHIEFLRDTMRCLIDEYLTCDVGDPNPCENGFFPAGQGKLATQALAQCARPPRDCR